MIQVRIREHEITMSGHAGIAPRGYDLVCAAVSALTYTLIDAIRAMEGANINATVDHGNVSVKWQHMNDTGKIIIDSWFIGICSINREYECITFI